MNKYNIERLGLIIWNKKHNQIKLEIPTATS